MDQGDYDQGQHQGEGGFREKGEMQTEVLYDFVDDRGQKNGGKAGPRSADAHSQTIPAFEPSPHKNRQGDHAGPGVGQTAQQLAKAVGGEGGSNAEDHPGGRLKQQTQRNGPPQTQIGAYLVYGEHTGQRGQAPEGGDKGSLGVGEAELLDQVGGIDGEQVGVHAHGNEHHQAAGKADRPGGMKSVVLGLRCVHTGSPPLRQGHHSTE